MKFHGLVSEQFKICSVCNGRANHFRTQAAPQAIAGQATAPGVGPSRHLDRTLSALWQSQLQVRKRSGARTQVLPLGELSGQVAANGLHPPSRFRTGQRALGQLHPDSRDLGRDVRDQSRAPSSARVTLRCGGEPDAPVAHRSHRSECWLDSFGQHAYGHDRRRPDAQARCGGQQ